MFMREIAFAVCLIGCANNVPQDRSTGPDGRQKGAQAIKLDNGEGVAKGIVTYPGGDRVDWKMIELPPGTRGRLDLSMKWTTPRPGLQLAFDVFDQWNNPVASAKGSRGARSRDASIDAARGVYFVRVYAKNRGDAGAYKLAVNFRPAPQVSQTSITDLEVPEPPRLPAVPGPCEIFDKNDPACADVCPEKNAPKNWPGCPTSSTTAVTPIEPPTGPTIVEPPPPKKNPITMRVIKADVQSGKTVVVLPYGSEAGVDKTWSGQVMRGDSNQPFPGGKLTIFRVDKTRSFATVNLTTDIVNANPVIVLTP